MKLTLIVALIFISSLCNGQHRKHVLGWVICTYPPIYTCWYCNGEIDANSLLPYKFDTMRIPMVIDVWDEKFKKTHKQTMYWNGYGRFINFLKLHHWNADSFFIAKWNKRDTSCISSEIKYNKIVYGKPKKKK